MARLEALASVRSGKLAIKQREKFAQAISDLPDDEYILSLEKAYVRRSKKQHNSFFGVAYRVLQNCFYEATGEFVTTEFVHEFAKARFLPGQYVERLKEEHANKPQFLNKNTGEVVEVPFILTTTKMTTVEAMDYYLNMQRFCAEFFNTDLPDPDKNYKEKSN